MSNRSPIVQKTGVAHPRVLFFGMRCAFSVPPLRALIDAGRDVVAVVVPGAPGSPPVKAIETRASPVIHLREPNSLPTVDDVAYSAGISLISVRGMRHPEVISAIEALAPDVIAVACFPSLIPVQIRSIPKFGCLNLHPSLLPRWRGPEPLFWTFKADDRETGATVHVMDGGFDTGPIVVQMRHPMLPGIDGRVLERELATLGGALLVEAIANVAGGTFITVAQNDSRASFAPMPDDEDFVFATDESATRIRNIVRGIVPLWGPVKIKIPASGAEFTVHAVLDMDATATQAEPYLRNKNALLLKCNPGVITLLESRNEGLRSLTGLDAV